jgi:hypothetical protein
VSRVEHHQRVALQNEFPDLFIRADSDTGQWTAEEKLPSGLSEASAACSQLLVLEFNFNSAMNRLELGDAWVSAAQGDPLPAGQAFPAAYFSATGSLVFGLLGGIRRTRYFLKHEGGCFAYAIRSDVEH